LPKMERQGRQANASILTGMADDGQEIGRKGGMDCRLVWRLHLGPYPGRSIFLPAKIGAGCRRGGLDRGCRYRRVVLCSVASSVDTVLETHARALWFVFHRCRLGSLVIRRPRCSRVQLVESALAHTRHEPVRIFKQQEMGAIRRPSRRCTKQEFFAPSPPVSFIVGSERDTAKPINTITIRNEEVIHEVHYHDSSEA
jgi:hypothetical protein